MQFPGYRPHRGELVEIRPGKPARTVRARVLAVAPDGASIKVQHVGQKRPKRSYPLFRVVGTRDANQQETLQQYRKYVEENQQFH